MRAHLRRRIMLWVWNGYPRWVTRRLWAETIAAVLCAGAGHEPIPDGCGDPGHDFCVFCERSLPGQAVR